MRGRGGGGIWCGLNRGNGLIREDMKEGFCGDESAHAVADEDGTDARVNGWGGSAGGDLEVDDNILKPARRISTFNRRTMAVRKRRRALAILETSIHIRPDRHGFRIEGMSRL